MPALATHTVQTAAPAGRLPPLRPSFAWQCLARAGLPSTARQQPRRLLAANASGAGPQQPPGGDGEDKEAPERLRFPAAAAAIRRQQIQQQRSEIWGRIGELVSYDSDEEDSVRCAKEKNHGQHSACPRQRLLACRRLGGLLALSSGCSCPGAP